MSIKSEYQYSDLTEKIIKIAIDVHKNLGPGFVEKIYQRALYLELKNSRLGFTREKRLSIYYKKVNLGYETVDFEIEGKVLIEVKAVSEINDIHRAQLLSYLKSSGYKVGLILNFARPTLEIKRIIN
ncbi:MAG: GxxExxY protein [Candidatus Levybacteria bacterium]|nr:GxxExxY protein [Candidatus Levybacteria bacterium]